jgi:hypothetical protein
VKLGVGGGDHVAYEEEDEILRGLVVDRIQVESEQQKSVRIA